MFSSPCAVYRVLWNRACNQQSPGNKDTEGLEIIQFYVAYFTDEKAQGSVAIVSKSDCKAGILKGVYEF